ncbi:hypothetical protein CgunFtcFv8_018224 [Champsocephalus gunnari]|uniref:Uncharacterized protein n=1 Tax=Champsocephalus gunnari TaxID=52237 RepID=A0AAN8DNS7_CHAGU|nr:hypothetical protein CgunFtcFv8_018224 [Champsocephalus gunnari]
MLDRHQLETPPIQPHIGHGLEGPIVKERRVGFQRPVGLARIRPAGQQRIVCIAARQLFITTFTILSSSGSGTL